METGYGGRVPGPGIAAGYSAASTLIYLFGIGIGVQQDNAASTLTCFEQIKLVDSASTSPHPTQTLVMLRFHLTNAARNSEKQRARCLVVTEVTTRILGCLLAPFPHFLVVTSEDPSSDFCHY